MSLIVDFKNVSMQGLESSPFAEALAGVRANEARYYWNKYQHRFVVEAAEDSVDTIDYVNHVLENERGLKFASRPLESSRFQVADLNMAYVFYQSGLSINVLYSVEPGGKRAVGFKLCEGMDVPDELADKFKFARQKSKLAGTIRGSYFVIKGEYPIEAE
ncbi:MAG: phage tail protein [Bifidobacterium aquikefiri]|uniref:Phage tail protein n=1 Tax=Bifidobacterium aquikefiri TaxID=1653207 RepID=A0A261G8G1_9BIFI|nr:phage tail protein [Bifidobacterium aquikefiri]OZG67708.1 phage tail protein [Bifidobacterium aquikefiri]